MHASADGYHKSCTFMAIFIKFFVNLMLRRSPDFCDKVYDVAPLPSCPCPRNLDVRETRRNRNLIYAVNCASFEVDSSLIHQRCSEEFQPLRLSNFCCAVPCCCPHLSPHRSLLAPGGCLRKTWPLLQACRIV